ncbi:tyrosine-protein phosphatase [Aeromicrobium sp. UC242_57]|uniref:tyrosine-protein phosphatase n=1 Tax=Aeromicrobium sp. UC242_57 TaxID=3374624 RepID=UPI0037A09822
MTPNLRDLGDLSTADGGVVASGRLLRSAVPRGTDVGLDGVEWPPSLVIDLRSAAELEPAHPLAARGSRVVHLPLLAALRPAPRCRPPCPSCQPMLVEASASLVDLARHVGHAPGRR